MAVSVEAGTSEVALSGRLDVHTVHDVRAAIHAALQRGSGDLVVNVRDLEMLDVTGLGMLVGVHRLAGRSGRRLVLREVGPQLERMLRISRLHRILTVEASTPA
jgi:anti-anti-sigma factor